VAFTAATLLQSSIGPGNLDVVAVASAFTGSAFLMFYGRDGAGWHGPAELVADGHGVTGVSGNPGFIQGTFGQQGNYELVVPLGDHLAHFWRDNDAAGYPWHGPTVLPPPGHGPRGPGSAALAVTFGSVSMIQTNLGDEQALTVMATVADTAGKHFLIGYTRDSSGWHGPDPLIADGNPITGISADD